MFLALGDNDFFVAVAIGPFSFHLLSITPSSSQHIPVSFCNGTSRTANNVDDSHQGLIKADFRVCIDPHSWWIVMDNKRPSRANFWQHMGPTFIINQPRGNFRQQEEATFFSITKLPLIVSIIVMQFPSVGTFPDRTPRN